MVMIWAANNSNMCYSKSVSQGTKYVQQWRTNYIPTYGNTVTYQLQLQHSTTKLRNKFTKHYLQLVSCHSIFL